MDEDACRSQKHHSLLVLREEIVLEDVVVVLVGEGKLSPRNLRC